MQTICGSFPSAARERCLPFLPAITQHAIFTRDARRPWQIMQLCAGSDISASGWMRSDFTFLFVRSALTSFTVREGGRRSYYTISTYAWYLMQQLCSITVGVLDTGSTHLSCISTYTIRLAKWRPNTNMSKIIDIFKVYTLTHIFFVHNLF